LLAGKSASAPLTGIHFQDMGKTLNDQIPINAFQAIFSGLYKNITSPSVSGTLNEALKSRGDEY